MNKTYILFDLDGTISDPKEGITKSIQFSLREFGIDVEDLDTLTPFIGPPLRDSYKQFYGFNEADTERAVAKYREYYAETGIFQNALYDGIVPLLKTLQDRGKQLFIATSKPTVYAEKILKHFEIDQYFAFISGCELDGRRSKKSEVIQYALDNMGITRMDEAIMIGDRKYDILGAKALGIDSVGVLYGYGDLQELTASKATFICETVDNILDVIK